MSSFDDELWVRCPEKHFGVSNLFLNVLLRREVFGGVVVANLDFVLKKKCIVRVRESMVLSKGLSFGFGFIHEEIASFGGRYEILPLGAQGLHRFGCGGLDSFGGAFGFIVKGKVVVRFYHDLFFQRENFWRWVGVGLTLTNGGLNIGVQLTNLLLQGGLPFRVFCSCAVCPSVSPSAVFLSIRSLSRLKLSSLCCFAINRANVFLFLG